MTPVALILVLAHAGHVLADAAIFGVPVGMVVGTIFILRRWGPEAREAQSRRSSKRAGSG